MCKWSLCGRDVQVLCVWYMQVVSLWQGCASGLSGSVFVFPAGGFGCPLSRSHFRIRGPHTAPAPVGLIFQKFVHCENSYTEKQEKDKKNKGGSLANFPKSIKYPFFCNSRHNRPMPGGSNRFVFFRRAPSRAIRRNECTDALLGASDGLPVQGRTSEVKLRALRSGGSSLHSLTRGLYPCFSDVCTKIAWRRRSSGSVKNRPACGF